MKNVYTLYLTFFLTAVLLKAQAQPNFALVGFATQNGGTTGGQAGTTVTATSYSQLKSYAESTTPYIIKVSGTISNGADGGQIRIKSNKSIIGEGSAAYLYGVGLDISSQNNIIIQNLKISMTGVTTRTEKAGVYALDGGEGTPAIQVNGGDAIGISGTSKNIWIDHCELFSEDPSKQTNLNLYDGLLDIKAQSGFITISWCYFHDHWKCGLVGAADDDLYDNRLVTFHHNYYKNIRYRMPMYRGATGHFFNNYLTNIDKASEIRAGTCVRVEKNYYEDFDEFAIYTTSDSPGKTERIDNYLSKTQSRAYPANCTATIPYTYSNVLTTTTTDVKTIVPQYSGVGKIAGTCTATTWYADTDGDGKGDPNTTKSSCTQPTGYVNDKTDLCPSDANKIAAGQCGCGVAETTCVDCNGVKNGTAILDNCGRCILGTTGKTACTSLGEAETDACAFDGITETKNTGYKGTSYLNVDNAVGTAITFNISTTTAGSKTISFRYANGGTTDRTGQISVNGTTLPNTLSFPATGTFTDWKAVDISLSLISGVNVVKLISYTADGLANIDQIGYVSTGLSKGSCVITGIENSSETSGISVFPNPTKNVLHFSREVDWKLLDSKGIELKSGKNENQIDLSSYGMGVYFVLIEGKSYKIIKE